MALFYSRIFFRNSVNGGYLIPFESKDDLSTKIRTGDEIEIESPAGGPGKVEYKFLKDEDILGIVE